MKVLLSPRARLDLRNQLQYLIDRNVPKAARDLEARIMRFLRETLVTTPRIGTFIEHRAVYETWIPGTRLVVWYRVTPDRIEVARFWHTAQDRHSTS